LRSESPDLWFLIRDQGDHSLSEGDVPEAFRRIGGALDGVDQAKLGWDKPRDQGRNSAGQMKRVDSAAGEVQIIATTNVKMSAAKSAMHFGLRIILILALPSLALMTLSTLIATPMVVRNALAGLDEAAQQAEEINIDRRGTRLPIETVPAEIAPLVRAVNEALGRLDEGYERDRRFLADAAHELRTPIAILTTRLESLPDGGEKTRLLEDVARLATLADQLLDLQRLEHHLAELSNVDLVTVCSQVTADLAPSAIAAGYEISLQSQTERIEALGDRSALERAVVNLVQNAIQYGGRQGNIVVAVQRPAMIEVSDEGPGIPAFRREQVFEPFYRLGPHADGVGLGLSLVREIVRLHHGKISVLDGPGGGARFRITLPSADTGQPLGAFPS
jgi:signal transduction histidine kinase